MKKLAELTNSSALQAKITKQQIQALVEELGFSKLDSDRAQFVQSTDSIDVSACPGSGKTTLAVLKFIALARQWGESNAGICVLSHTNVAKDEVINRLQALGEPVDVEGRPHFVGTIDTFISKFIAGPYLASHKCPITVIDRDQALRKRERLLSFAARSALEKGRKWQDLLEAKTEAFETPCGEKLGRINPGTQTYLSVTQAIQQSYVAGVYTWQEIVRFGIRCIDKHPKIAAAIRQRFPFVILDEAQDTDELRAELLHKVFGGEDSEVVIQRIGDPNQRLYSKSDESFPAEEHLTISDSFRLNSEVAAVADRFALAPVQPSGLKGKNDSASELAKHLILFNPEGDIECVLPRFAEICAQQLSPGLIREGKITAVGARHRDTRANDRDSTRSNSKIPYSVADYLSTYRPRDSQGMESQRNSLWDYVLGARSLVFDTGIFSQGINHLSSGVLESLGIRGGRLSGLRRPYAFLIDQIENEENWEWLAAEIGKLVDPGVPIDEERFSQFAKAVFKILTDETTSSGSYVSNQQEFIFQITPATTAAKPSTHDSGANNFSHENVTIEVGSIHSVKGETHLATLLLDTFTYKYHVEAIKEWLIDPDKLKSSIGVVKDQRDLDRLRQAYVALSRPTALVGIAVPYETLGLMNRNEAENNQNIISLRAAGWNVVDAGTGKVIDESLFSGSL